VTNALPPLDAFFHPQRVVIFPAGSDKNTTLTRLAHTFADTQTVGDHPAWVKALFEREDVTSTGLGNGIAIPHAQHSSIAQFAFGIGITGTHDESSGIAYQAKDNKPVRLMVMMAAPLGDRPTYLKMLASLAVRLHQPSRIAAMVNARDQHSIIDEFLR
jgi:fructose PTS system EIIBC or EIIC component